MKREKTKNAALRKTKKENGSAFIILVLYSARTGTPIF